MKTIEKVFKVSGNKLESLVITDNALLFSSVNTDSFSEFMEKWDKKISLSTKVEINYDKIKSILNEHNSDDILISYKAMAGMPSNCQFSFGDEDDYQEFFNIIQTNPLFVKSEETLSSFKAISSNIVWLLIIIAVTTFSYITALGIENGDTIEGRSGKTRLFVAIIDSLGKWGVLLLGLGATGYVCYHIYLRYINPPAITKFVKI